MLDNLTSKLSGIVKGILGKYRLSDSNIKDVLKKFRKILLEADVSWDVVKLIISNVKKKLIDLEISRKISPGDIFLKVLNDEIINILGGKNLNNNNFLDSHDGLNIILFVGLQGVGKTTNLVKVSRYIEQVKKKKNVY